MDVYYFRAEEWGEHILLVYNIEEEGQMNEYV
jgi:hypothetical protein